jgi:arabinogalactan endo-1,4-beta-galactosidase
MQVVKTNIFASWLPGNKGLGVLYWEPEAYANWNRYALGAFDNRGVPTTALNPFRN